MHVLVLVEPEHLRRGLCVQEERPDVLDVALDDGAAAGLPGADGGGRQQLHGVAQGRFGAHLAQDLQGFVVDLVGRYRGHCKFEE